MEKFLKDYVQMISEEHLGERLNKTTLQDIVDNLMAEEEIWNLLDNYIYEQLDDVEEDD